MFATTEDQRLSGMILAVEGYGPARAVPPKSLWLRLTVDAPNCNNKYCGPSHRTMAMRRKGRGSAVFTASAPEAQ
eukprot:1750816-Alexandrium_andersonii.AAC.1